MTVMSTDSSASLREQTSNNITSETTKGKDAAGIVTSESNVERRDLDPSIKRRARLLITKGSIPKATRQMIHYALQIRDPFLAQVVRRVEAGEMRIDSFYAE
jgi:hypothetical protein